MNKMESKTAQRQLQLSRRHFLRGLGACVALPAFTSLPTRLLGAESAVTPLATTGGSISRPIICQTLPSGMPRPWWRRRQTRQCDAARPALTLGSPATFGANTSAKS